MEKIQLLVLLLVLAVLESRFLTSELVLSHQQETSDEVLLRRTYRQVHAVSSMMEMTTATTTTDGLRISTEPQHPLELTASLTNGKDPLTEVSNTRAKHSVSLPTGTLDTLQDDSGPLTNGISMEKVTPFPPDSGEKNSIQRIFQTSRKPAPQLAELPTVETTNGMTMLNKTFSSTSTAMLRAYSQTESSPVNSSTSTTVLNRFTSRMSTTLTSKEKTTHRRITSPALKHTASTKRPLLLSTSETPEPHNNLTPTMLSSITTTEVTTQANTMTSLTQQIIKSQKPSQKPQGSSNSGITVAVIIVVLLVLMAGMIVVILLKKRYWQPQKKEDPAWAGPSPFLDGEIQPRLVGAEEDSVTQKPSSKRASLQSFILRRSDKRQSLLTEEDDQVAMEELQAGSTFGRVQDRESPLGNGTTPINGVKDNPPESMPSFEGNVNLGQDPIMEESTSPALPLDTPTPSTGPLLDIDLGPPTGEEPPPTASEAPLVPPPPPLPSSEQ